MTKRALGFILLAIAVSGCETLKMPLGPDMSSYELIADAPVVAISVSDARSKDKIGMIGLDTLKVKRSDTPALARNRLAEFLHQLGINVVPAPAIDFGRTESVKSAAETLHAQGVLKFEINAIHVRSIDLILDSPEYEVDAFLAVYSAGGKLLFHESLHGSTESRAFTSKRAGAAVETALRNAILALNGSNAFDKTIEELKR
jgi:hypothetical protein